MRFAAVAAIVGLALLAGCKERKGQADFLARRLCSALHTLPEERRAQCCRSRPGIAFEGPCVEALSGALRANAIALDDARASACAASIERAYAGCEWVGPFAPEPPAECQGLLAGRRKAGEACRSSLECEGALLCAGAGPTDEGRCAPAGGAGAICSTAVDALASYTRQDVDRLHPQCGGFCNRHRCVEKVALGRSCQQSIQCGPGRHCAAGKCTEGLARAGDECSGGDCEAGLRCLQGRCFVPLAEGAPCAGDLECRGGCLAGDGASRCGQRCDLR